MKIFDFADFKAAALKKIVRSLHLYKFLEQVKISSIQHLTLNLG